MTTKLTLTIEDKVIDSAKKYAKQKGESLSGIVSNYLKSLSTPSKGEYDLDPKISRMMGVINLSEDFDYKKELGDAITKKHQ